jgi:eukaryotic-like serine/threonine-protein kinase
VTASHADPVSTIERLNTALEGRYRVEREIGEGGMATVYLAEDVRHGRQVAVKVLRPELAAMVGAERFLAEIRTTAALQHPHILPLHDSGEADGFLFYVMPYVQGDSLRDRLDRERQLPVQEAVEIARKVADALAYAHEQGIIHRDIKPANILLSRGDPLVADFGIALALSEAGGGRITETGLSLGTPHYMSPEQATGERTLGPRSDVYALGCVLYEMLVGEPPFPAPTAQAVLVRILTGEPRRVTESRHTVPAHVDGVVAKSLEKLPADRFGSAKAFAAALTDPSFEYTQVRGSPSTGAAAATGWGGIARASPGWFSARRSTLFVAALGLIVVAAIAAVASFAGPPLPSVAAGVLPSHRFVLAEPDEFNASYSGGVAIAPDGTIVFTAGLESETSLRVRFPGELRARPLPGTAGAFHPTFSPDGQWIVFSTGSELRTVPARGGPVVVLARTEDQAGVFIHPYWATSGVIAAAQDDGLYWIPEVGGTPVKVYEAGSRWGARTPVILPKNAGWVFAQGVGAGISGRVDLMLLDPESGETRLLAEGGSSPAWLETGHLAFVHPSGSLFAAPFDLRRGAFAAPPVPVMDSVRYGGVTRTFAASPGGTAVYVAGAGTFGVGEGAEILLLGVSGGDDRVLPLPRTDHGDGQFSPDGRKLAYTRDDHIWIFDLELGTHLQLTADGSDHHDPVWSPDGARIAFGSARGSTGVDIWIKDMGGDTPARPLLEMEGTQFPKEWTDDDLLVIQTDHAGRLDIYTMPADGSAAPRPYLRADWNDALPRVSPDGRWLAYESSERGQPGIVVRSFPEPGRAFLVSEPGVGAVEPVWSPDGTTVYYRQMPSEEIIAAEVRTAPEFEVVRRDTVGRVSGELRDAHPGGQWLLTFRFGPGEDGETGARLIGVVNWFSELAQRLGER